MDAPDSAEGWDVAIRTRLSLKWIHIPPSRRATGALGCDAGVPAAALRCPRGPKIFERTSY